jgi:hypothetical protein
VNPTTPDNPEFLVILKADGEAAWVAQTDLSF